MASKIMTAAEIESEARKIKGTWVKRSNARKRMIDQSNSEINEKIMVVKGKIRDLKALGAKEETLRYWYSETTKLELQKIC